MKASSVRFMLRFGFVGVLGATSLAGATVDVGGDSGVRDLGGGLATATRAQVPPQERQLVREVFAELIAIRTVAGTDTTVAAAEAMADRLIAADFPRDDVQVVGPAPQLGNLVARYRGDGSGGPPILLMAHIDVVDALRSDWTMEPFTLTEEDGWYYGRGTTDNKAGAAHLVASFIRLRREGFVPSRDLIMVLTADEETTGASIDWLVTERRDLVDAELALNTDAGGGALKDGEPAVFQVQASEKVYLTFELEVRNPGGHSSRPRPDNAVYRLAEGLVRLSRFEFPIELNEVTSTYFERTADTVGGQMAEDMRALARGTAGEAAVRRLAVSPYYNALMRTTCVATRLEAGHADNALPQTAKATVNCRILPGTPPEDVERTLQDVLADPQVAISRIGVPTPSPPSPLTAGVMGTIERLVGEMWPGVPVVPVMSTGATDGLFVRNAGIPVYGVSAIFGDPDDARAHGQDERVGVEEFYDAYEFWYRMLKAFTE